MTTPQDLMIVTLDLPASRTVERGDLSLALAAAETIDLLRAGAAALVDGRVVPAAETEARPSGGAARSGEVLLGEAARALAAGPDGEPLTEWLWRRGRGLAQTYLDALEADGLLLRERTRGRFRVPRGSRLVLAQSPERRRAAHRAAADEPVLRALGAALALPGGLPPGAEPVTDGEVMAVLRALSRNLAELDVERHRRARRLSEAARTNTRRGF
jgi:hypothetical protein